MVEEGQLVAVDLDHHGERRRVEPSYVVVADGSMNRFGRELGSVRRKDYPMGLAARGYYSSPRSTDPFLESQLDLRDETGATMPGYGWVFPLGDGTVNVGVGLLTTSEAVEARQHHPDDGGLRPDRSRTTGASRRRPS